MEANPSGTGVQRREVFVDGLVGDAQPLGQELRSVLGIVDLASGVRKVLNILDRKCLIILLYEAVGHDAGRRRLWICRKGQSLPGLSCLMEEDVFRREQ